MKFLVKYVDFHPDNHQGGSGKSFEFKTMIELSSEVKCSDIWGLIHTELERIVKNQRPYSVKNECKFAIKSVEIY